MDILTAWHGTNQSFDSFDEGLLGLSNPNTASQSAFFFARRPETAWSYAQSAARKLVPDYMEHEERVARLLHQALQASMRGDHNLSESLYLQVEELETEAISAPPAGARVLECELSIANPLLVDGASRDVTTNLGGVLSRARQAGYDAVIIREIRDTPCGSMVADDHIAIFSSEQIAILREVFDLPEALQEESPEEALLEMC